MDRPGLRLTTLGIVLLVGACRTTPDVPVVYDGPSVTSEVSHFPGTPVSGPRPEGTLDEGAATTVVVTFVALERIPEGVLLPASSTAHLILSPGRESAVLSSGQLSRGMRFGSGPEAEALLGPTLRSGELGRHTVLAALRGIVAPGVTAHFSLTSRDERRVEDIPDPIRPRLSVLVTPAKSEDGSLLLALSLEGLLTEEEPDILVPGGDLDVEEPPAAPRILRDETVLVRVPAGEAGVVVVPSPFDRAGVAGIAVRVERRPPTPESSGEHLLFEDSLARARRDVDEAAREARTRPSTETAVWPGAGGALDADDRTPFRRRALAFLARATGASLAEDVALAAPDSVLNAVVDRVRPALLDGGGKWDDRAAFGWLFEAAAWSVLAQATSDPDAPPGLAALLVRHAGETGRHPDLLSDLVSGAGGIATLTRRLVEENLVFLEDNAPGARIRAFDWLSARDAAPEGYLPLASRKERRAALTRALDAAADAEESR